MTYFFKGIAFFSKLPLHLHSEEKEKRAEYDFRKMPLL